MRCLSARAIALGAIFAIPPPPYLRALRAWVLTASFFPPPGALTPAPPRSIAVILDCNDGNVPFYEKCGFVAKERQMALYV